MALISRKPYCNNCLNRGKALAYTDYRLYPCCVNELAEKFPDKVLKSGIFAVTEKMRCPDKAFFKPIYSKEEQRKYNNHK